MFSLRPVNMMDFEVALKKLKASVDSGGKEMKRVLEWNEKYGEIKKSKRGKKNAPFLSMYI